MKPIWIRTQASTSSVMVVDERQLKIVLGFFILLTPFRPIFSRSYSTFLSSLFSIRFSFSLSNAKLSVILIDCTTIWASSSPLSSAFRSTARGALNLFDSTLRLRRRPYELSVNTVPSGFSVLQRAGEQVPRHGVTTALNCTMSVVGNWKKERVSFDQQNTEYYSTEFRD